MHALRHYYASIPRIIRLVRLEVTGEGTAEGTFLGGTDSFMPARPHAAPRLGNDIYTWIDEVETTERPTTAGPEILDPWDGWTSMFIAHLVLMSLRDARLA
jgi:hypothetical protein